MINLSIDVMKLQKERFHPGKNGAKYANLVVMELNEPDQYGNTHIVKQSCTKEEREAGVKMPIIGNGKAFHKRQQSSGRNWKKPAPQDGPPDDSEPPF